MEITPYQYEDIELDTYSDESLVDLDLDDLVDLCYSNKKYRQACSNEEFIENYENKNFAITTDLIIYLSRNPYKFLDWVKNYIRWYIISRNIDDDLLNKLVDDKFLEKIKDNMRTDHFDTKFEEEEESQIISYHIKLLDLGKFPSSHDILLIIFGIVYRRFQAERDTSKDMDSNIELLSDHPPSSDNTNTLLYALFDFIVQNRLENSTQFIMIYIIFYYYTEVPDVWFGLDRRSGKLMPPITLQ